MDLYVWSGSSAWRIGCVSLFGAESWRGGCGRLGLCVIRALPSMIQSVESFSTSVDM